MAKANKGSVVDTTGYKYKTTKVRDADGKVRHSIGNDDAVARAMLGMTADDLKVVAKANGLEYPKSANNGLSRMSFGHMLRGLVRGGIAVKIGKVTVKTLSQRVALPKAA